MRPGDSSSSSPSIRLKAPVDRWCWWTLEIPVNDCLGCGELVPKALSERTHRCPSCGLVLDRDHNSALCIFQGWKRPTAPGSGPGAIEAHPLKGMGTSQFPCLPDTAPVRSALAPSAEGTRGPGLERLALASCAAVRASA